MEYMNKEEDLILREYGRNVQKLVKYITSLDDKAKRTEYAHALIGLMRQLNPSVKEHASDSPQRIWDHLFVMSDFKLDVDGPYPMPDPELIYSKPQKMHYNTKELKYKHYGRNIELLIEKAVNMETEEEKENAVLYVGKLMKTFYASFNKDNSMDDELIVTQLYNLSEGRIDMRQQLKEANGNLFGKADKLKDNRINNQVSENNNGKKGQNAKKRSRRRK